MKDCPTLAPYTPRHKVDDLTAQLYVEAGGLFSQGLGQLEIAKALSLAPQIVDRMSTGRWKGAKRSVGKFLAPEDAYPVVKKMYEDAKALHEEGKVFRQIAARLGVSIAFVQKLAAGTYNPKNLSERILATSYSPNTAEADEATIDAAKELMEKGFGVRHIAATLNLRPAVIRSIEDDNYQRQPIAAKFKFNGDTDYVCPPEMSTRVIEMYRAARALAAEGLCQRDIAKAMNINTNTVTQLKRGVYATRRTKKPVKEEEEDYRGGASRFGCFIHLDGKALCDCGESFDVSPHHLKFVRKCWHIDRAKKNAMYERLSRRQADY